MNGEREKLGVVDVIPVGVFGPKFSLRRLPHLRQELQALVGQVEIADRVPLGSYLRKGAIVMAFMEFTTDLLSNSFGVAGGSAILTDGAYFWRRDAAEYVETYGIGVPAEFLEHARNMHWVPPHITPEEVARIDHLISGILRGDPLPSSGSKIEAEPTESGGDPTQHKPKIAGDPTQDKRRK